MIAADDPRHGERAGYLAGCREACCRVPHVRYQKRSSLRRLREGSQYVDPAPVLARLDKWARYGVTPRAVALAAGLAESCLSSMIRDNTRAEKATARKALAVTWADLPDTALVYADLTRWRIFSLMAAGHPLAWICGQVDGLNVGGKWREQEKVTLGLARAVQAIYDSAPAWGPSKATAAKARNRGHVTPAAWDDPGVPAMPKGWAPELAKTRTAHRPKTDVDEAVVLRVLAGDRLPMTTAERREVVRRAIGRGWTEREIEERTGITQATSKSRYGTEGEAA